MSTPSGYVTDQCMLQDVIAGLKHMAKETGLFALHSEAITRLYISYARLWTCAVVCMQDALIPFNRSRIKIVLAKNPHLSTRTGSYIHPSGARVKSAAASQTESRVCFCLCNVVLQLVQCFAGCQNRAQHCMWTFIC